MEDTDSKINGDVIDANLWNQAPKELGNFIESTGQTLSSADLFQVSKSVAEYVANGNFYDDTGSPDIYTLGTIDAKISVEDYIDGMEINFIANSTNTGGSTVQVNALPIINLVDSTGSALIGGEVTAGNFIKAVYNLPLNEFRLVLGKASLTNSGFTTYSNATNSGSQSESATPLAVSTAKAEAIAASAEFPSTTIMLFGQQNAPPGWARLTRYDDHIIRITSSGTSGGGQEGSVSSTSVFTTSRTTSSHTLTVSEIPSHNHTLTRGDTNTTGSFNVFATKAFPTTGTTITSSTGDGGGHSHSTNLNVQRAIYIECQKA